MRRSRWIGWEVGVVAGGGTESNGRPISRGGFSQDLNSLQRAHDPEVHRLSALTGTAIMSPGE
jgi:hypothetical protein